MIGEQFAPESTKMLAQMKSTNFERETIESHSPFIIFIECIFSSLKEKVNDLNENHRDVSA